MPSLFLTPQGKIIADCFIIKRHADYLIDVGNKSYNDLINLFRKRRLTSDITLAPVPYNVYQLMPPLIRKNNTEPDIAANTYLETGITAKNSELSSTITEEHFIDPRHSQLGLRILSNNKEPPTKLAYTIINEQDYKYYQIILRHLKLIEDVGYAYGKRLVPHDINMDNQMYISRTKGCYTGQEIVNKLRNKTLFPRYTLEAGTADVGAASMDTHRVMQNLNSDNLTIDLLNALICYINCNYEPLKDYCMKVMQKKLID